jgi:hypothetical protein
VSKGTFISSGRNKINKKRERKEKEKYKNLFLNKVKESPLYQCV